MSQRVSPAGPMAEVAVDPSAQAVGMLGFGARGDADRPARIEQVPPSTPVTWAAAQRADAVSLAELERLVRAAPAGWGLMLAGPATDVVAAREAALGFGMLPAEIRSAVTGEVLRRVWCPHCTASTDTDVQPGESVECSGCTVPLRVPTPRARDAVAESAGPMAGPASSVA
jgi:hypothetical protein